ncbi:glycosyltransferase family 2 protein [Lactiplantibacillus argentoratensis]|nr:glycosyltransferase family 2 protein [Lactiplantibacillus argentoratensis]MBT1145964.1 glycosyltransferase family 2 protein [Lactiplantibacillus argentoratensis]MBT1148719.1 glycosyltransferase family 2 protein [Lactiplantibacillus argentoratensis]MBT1152950.1 glycosyltransferase family 2 protein [Lactiplantibacillus argentoratensis]MCT0195552.1 glycosyltransferase [Lactiplantibacillus plantarum]
MKMTVCAIVVTYNRSKLLRKCLAAIENQSVNVDHIMVIDNHSNDSTQSIMEDKVSKSRRFIYKRLDDNYGGAGGFKRGISAGMNVTGDDYFWIMDDDTIPTETALEKLLDAAQAVPNFGFLAANVHWKDGTPMNVPWPAKDWAEKAKNDLVKVTISTFVSLFVSRANIRRVGLPLEEFFIWGDDVEYTLRLSKQGPGYFVCDSLVVHESSSNESPSIYTDSAGRIDRYYYLYRNELYIDRKHRTKRRCIRIFLRDLGVSGKVLIKGQDHKLQRANVVLKGAFAGLKFSPKG